MFTDINIIVVMGMEHSRSFMKIQMFCIFRFIDGTTDIFTHLQELLMNVERKQEKAQT
jgi:hypothetical protein